MQQKGVESVDVVRLRQLFGVSERRALRQFDPIHAVEAQRIRQPTRQRAIDALRLPRRQRFAHLLQDHALKVRLTTHDDRELVGMFGFVQHQRERQQMTHVCLAQGIGQRRVFGEHFGGFRRFDRLIVA